MGMREGAIASCRTVTIVYLKDGKMQQTKFDCWTGATANSHNTYKIGNYVS